MKTHSHVWSNVISRLPKTTTVVLALSVMMQTFVCVPKVYGYAVDVPASGTIKVAHSSFHYDMTRVLALGAGFTVDEAEYLAAATEAMDNGAFRGYTGVLAIINNIQRFPRVSGNNSYFYHWGRRGPDYPRAAFSQAQSDTCIYFDHSGQTSYASRPCRKTPQGHVWEIYEIRDWALNGAYINPPGKRPVTARSPRGPFLPVRGKTIEALAIYVHTLGDSYSHDLCMQKDVVRQHNPASKYCTAQWHTTEEFADGQSVPTTIIAANEIWKVLKDNRARFSTCKASAPWTDMDAQRFIETFVKTGTASDGTERANYCKAEFDKIVAACQRRAFLFDFFGLEDANLAASIWKRA